MRDEESLRKEFTESVQYFEICGVQVAYISFTKLKFILEKYNILKFNK